MSAIKKHKSFKFKIAVWGTLFFCLLAGVGYVLFFSPIFLVREIAVSGNQEISSQQIQDIVRREISGKIYGFLAKNNLWLLDENGLQRAILQTTNQISQVVVENHQIGWQGAKLAIVVQERQSEAIVCRLGVLTPQDFVGQALVGDTEQQIFTDDSGLRLKSGLRPTDQSSDVVHKVFDQCFYVDQQGIAFKPAPQTKGNLILLIGAPYDLALGAEAIKPPLLQAAQTLKKTLAEQIPDLAINYFIVANSQEVQLKTQAGWLAYFDIKTDLARQTRILKELLKQTIDKTKDLKYIDLRLEQKVFYKEAPKS